MELLMVMVVGSILIAIISGAYMQARQNAKRARAETQLRELVKAWTEYWLAYEQWPTSPSLNGQTDVDMTYENLEPLFGTLANGSPNPNNTRALPFLSLKILPGETYKDPWGNPYKISFRTQAVSHESALRITVGFPNRDRYRQ